jgi:hypothetical protein
MANFKPSHAYSDFARRVTREHRYLRDEEDQDFLSTMLKQAKKSRMIIMKGGSFLWRAQFGFEWERIPEIDDCAEGPFPPARMKPLRNQAREGRANPQGIPCLYLSNRQETALSEVRPWLHSLISVAQFKLVRDLRIADFSSDGRPRRIGYVIPKNRWNRAVWYEIDQAFRKPVLALDDSPSDYAPTQAIAEYFKTHRFDGIAYQSAFQDNSGKGHNLAVFDLDLAELVNCVLMRVEDVTFRFDQFSNAYMVRQKKVR